MFTEKFIKKFWSYVKVGPINECWEWQRSYNKGSYGVTYYKGKQYKTHRLSWWLTNGMPELHVCHHCDNPKCCNPNHLFLGTDADNVQDKCKKGRQRHKAHPGERNGRAKLNEKNVLDIKKSLNEGIDGETLARNYDVTRQTIHKIKHNLLWKHLS